MLFHGIFLTQRVLGSLGGLRDAVVRNSGLQTPKSRLPRESLIPLIKDNALSRIRVPVSLSVYSLARASWARWVF